MTYATSRSDQSNGVMTEREENPPLTSVISLQRNILPEESSPPANNRQEELTMEYPTSNLESEGEGRMQNAECGSGGERRRKTDHRGQT